jgi:ABC-type spermidine/putrescine transport system permease subunit II
MARWTPERRRKARVKAGFSAYYVLFLIFIYGPMFAMFALSFQGRRGGTSFPMRGLSLYWWGRLLQPSTIGDLRGSLARSLICRRPGGFRRLASMWFGPCRSAFLS